MLRVKQIEGEDILLRYKEIKEELDKALEHSSGEWTAALGGSKMYDDMPQLITEFEKMIKEYESIDVLEFTGRRGFIKQLTTVGWKERYTTMRKSLKENIDV